MSLTWRQIVAYLEFSDTLDRIDRIYDLAIAATGAQGNEESLKKLTQELQP
jgi:hypothetical protein